jgi:cytochrome c5
MSPAPPRRRVPRLAYAPARRMALLLMVAALALGATALFATLAQGPEITPASGKSWLAKMGRPMASTALGRAGLTGKGPGRPAPRPSLAEQLRHGVEITGEDLYRYGCRSCHGAGGAGLPPEILPITTGVLATSVVVQTRIGEEAGEADSRDAAQRAERAQLALRHRLQEGGGAMPSFDHFSADEVELLLGYLRQISGVGVEPGEATVPRTLRRSADRVGEHIVKGTCQVCHDAKVPDPRRAAEDRGIPTLASFTEQLGIHDFRSRALHRRPAQPGSGRVPPELYYFDASEIEGAYLYLAAYPPE